MRHKILFIFAILAMAWTNAGTAFADDPAYDRSAWTAASAGISAGGEAGNDLYDTNDPYFGDAYQWLPSYPQNAIDANPATYLSSFWGTGKGSSQIGYEDLPQILVIDMKAARYVSKVTIAAGTTMHSDWPNGKMKDVYFYTSNTAPVAEFTDYTIDYEASKADRNAAYWAWVSTIQQPLLDLGVGVDNDAPSNIPASWTSIGNIQFDDAAKTILSIEPADASGRYLIIVFPNAYHIVTCIGNVEVYGSGEVPPAVETDGDLQTFVPDPDAVAGTTWNLADQRDSKVYKAVKFPNGQIWLYSDFNYTDGLTEDADYKLKSSETDYPYYTFEKAIEIAPVSWRLAEFSEWQAVKSSTDQIRNNGTAPYGNFLNNRGNDNGGGRFNPDGGFNDSPWGGNPPYAPWTTTVCGSGSVMSTASFGSGDAFGPQGCGEGWGELDQAGFAPARYIYDPATVPPPPPALAFDAIEDGAAWEVSLGTYDETEIVIPDTYDSKPVKQIKINGFRGSAITSVTIPASVEIISEGAFWGCASLTEINLNEGLKEIHGVGAFKDITAYTDELYIPDGVTKIGESVFHQSQSMSISIPSSVTDWSGCQQFAHWQPGQTITVRGYTEEQAVAAGWDLECILDNNEGAEFVWESSVNVDVEEVTLDREAVSIEIGRTSQLTATVSPENATNKAVTWSSDDEEIATVDEDGLVTAVALGEAIITVTTVDGEKTATATVTVIEPGPVATSWKIGAPTLDDITATLDLETGIVAIAGTGATRDFPISYGGVHVGGGAPWVGEMGGVADGEVKDATSWTSYPNAASVAGVSIGEGITKIGSAAFWLEEGIYVEGTLTLPSTLTSIGSRAFSAHKFTGDITVPEGVTTIGGYAFEQSSGGNVTKVSLPSTLTTIGGHALDISTLTELYITAETPPTTTESTFAAIDKETCVLYVPAGKKTLYEAADNWKEFTHITGLSAIDNVDAAKAIKSIEYYDLLGRPTVATAKGILLQKITYENGTAEFKKIFVYQK